MTNVTAVTELVTLHETAPMTVLMVSVGPEEEKGVVVVVVVVDGMAHGEEAGIYILWYTSILSLFFMWQKLSSEDILDNVSMKIPFRLTRRQKSV